MTTLTKVIAGAILAVVLAFGANSYITSRQLKGRLAAKDGQITLLTTKNTDLQAKLDESLAAYSKDIAAKDAIIQKDKAEITLLKTSLVQSNRDLDAIRESWANLDAGCQAKLHELDDAWAKKFSIADGIIVLQAHQIEQLKLQIVDYKASVDAWAQKYATLQELNTTLRSGYDTAIARVKSLQLTGTLKWALPVVGVIVGHFVWK